jgi:hypothetical protein
MRPSPTASVGSAKQNHLLEMQLERSHPSSSLSHPFILVDSAAVTQIEKLSVGVHGLQY